MASERLSLLGLPEGFATYDQAIVWQVLSGAEVDPAASELVHDKLAWASGNGIISHLNNRFPGQGWTSRRFVVRSIGFGLSSASFQAFEDGSHLILVSKLLQETLISMTNICIYFDVTRGISALSFRERKREQQTQELVARIGSMFRYLTMSQRLTGRTPMPMAALDKRSRDSSARLCVGAVMFAIAHELGHIALGHADASVELYEATGPITVSQLQELQADSFAFKLLSDIMADDPESVVWSAFIALFSRQIVETAALVRTGQTHPRGYERWGVVEKSIATQDERGEKLRLALMASMAAALKRDEAFPVEFWRLLCDDKRLTIEAGITPQLLAHWDDLQVRPLAELHPIVLRAATSEGNKLLAELATGDIRSALRRLGVPSHEHAEIVNPSAPLPFFALKSAIDNCSTVLTTGDRFVLSVFGARLAAAHLKGDGPDDG